MYALPSTVALAVDPVSFVLLPVRIHQLPHPVHLTIGDLSRVLHGYERGRTARIGEGGWSLPNSRLRNRPRDFYDIFIYFLT